MSDIKVAFWNLGNLLDINATPLAADLEFTPDRGWTREVLNKKIENLASIIKQLHDGDGPDLLGLCEIENEELAKGLVDKVGRDDLDVVQYIDSPDIRGIDTCLIYSKNKFAIVNSESHNIHYRYPTRDIFQVKVEVRENNAQLDVLVNHWPSRRKGQCETEPFRNTVGENCGRIVDRILKIPSSEVEAMPDKLEENEEALSKLDLYWNKNVLVMGDLNDEPYDKSILNYLRATPNPSLLQEWRHIFKLLRKDRDNGDKNDKQLYLEQPAYLYDCMWPLIPDGSSYFWKTGSMNMLDHFVISRGLYYGSQKLRMDLEQLRIFKKGMRVEDHIPSQKVDSVELGSPLGFVWTKIDSKGTPRPPYGGRVPNTGYSDHFPIQAVIKTI